MESGSTGLNLGIPPLIMTLGNVGNAHTARNSCTDTITQSRRVAVERDRWECSMVTNYGSVLDSSRFSTGVSNGAIGTETANNGRCDRIGSGAWGALGSLADAAFSSSPQ